LNGALAALALDLALDLLSELRARARAGARSRHVLGFTANSMAVGVEVGAASIENSGMASANFIWDS
jgi:hypothetical protein